LTTLTNGSADADGGGVGRRAAGHEQLRDLGEVEYQGADADFRISDISKS
jgi:hypothetical protein